MAEPITILSTSYEDDAVRDLTTGETRPYTALDIVLHKHALKGHWLNIAEDGDKATVTWRGSYGLLWLGAVLTLPLIFLGGPFWWYLLWDAMAADKSAEYWLRYDGACMQGNDVVRDVNE